MVVIVGLLERILASKAAVKQKAKEQKESALKVVLIMYFMARHTNVQKLIQKANENHIAGEAIQRVALTGMHAQWSNNKIIPDSEEEQVRVSRNLKWHHNEDESELNHNGEERVDAHHGSKRCCHQCCNERDEKYDAIFQLLERAEECGKRMEMRAEQNQKEAFKQAARALESYNKLSERILHVIINIGGSDSV